MCTYITNKVEIAGSGKGAAGWFPLTDASVYFDHPQHAQVEHSLNLDFLNPAEGPAARVAVELTAEAGRALAEAILRTLDAVPPGLIEPAGTAPAASGTTRPGEVTAPAASDAARSA